MTLKRVKFPSPFFYGSKLSLSINTREMPMKKEVQFTVSVACLFLGLVLSEWGVPQDDPVFVIHIEDQFYISGQGEDTNRSGS